MRALQGSGPFGIPTQNDVRNLTAQFERSLGKPLPEVRELWDSEGADEVRQMLSNRLAEKAGARFIKLLLGPTPKGVPPQQRLRRESPYNKSLPSGL